MALDADLDLLRLHGQGHAALGTDLDAGGDGFSNIREGFLAGLTLTDATAWASTTSQLKRANCGSLDPQRVETGAGVRSDRGRVQAQYR